MLRKVDLHTIVVFMYFVAVLHVLVLKKMRVPLATIWTLSFTRVMCIPAAGGIRNPPCPAVPRSIQNQT